MATKHRAQWQPVPLQMLLSIKKNYTVLATFVFHFTVGTTAAVGSVLGMFSTSDSNCPCLQCWMYVWIIKSYLLRWNTFFIYKSISFGLVDVHNWQTTSMFLFFFCVGRWINHIVLMLSCKKKRTLDLKIYSTVN